MTNCHAFKMRLTDVADTEQLFRLIQSIPSPKAEPFKQWMAHVAKDARRQLEEKLGRSVISSSKATDFLPPPTEEIE